MKNIVIGLILGLLLGGAVTWSFLRHAPAELQKEAKPEAKEEPRLQHTTNGEAFLKLDPKSQERIGLKVAALQAKQTTPEIKGYGRVLDPAPLAALIAEGATARASLDASTKAYQRLKKLNEQGQNASTRDLEAAEALMKRDKIQLDTVQTRLTLALGKTAAEQSDLPALIEGFASLKTALARIDLPLGQALETPPKDGQLAALVAPDKPLPAKFLGPVASTDPQTQGQGYLFLINSNPPPPGAAMIGWLQVPGEPQSGVLVPRSALLRHEGENFVYVQTSPETFQRKEVDLVRPLEAGYFVKHGVSAKDKVVVVGAQELLSEELKSEGGGEE